MVGKGWRCPRVSQRIFAVVVSWSFQSLALRSNEGDVEGMEVSCCEEVYGSVERRAFARYEEN